jgi:hypothetical protein
MIEDKGDGDTVAQQKGGWHVRIDGCGCVLVLLAFSLAAYPVASGIIAIIHALQGR